MNPSIVTVANAFYVGAAVVGVPSFLTTLLYAYFRARLIFSPGPATSSFSGVKNPDAILMILGVFERTIVAIANFLGGISQVVFGVMAAVAAVGLLFAVALFLTGRGLHAHAGWARGLGGVMMAGVFLVSLFSVLAVRGPFLLFGLLGAVGSGFALLTLWRGFAI